MSLKRRNYTGSLKYSENNIDHVISVIKQFPKYAFITHDKDVGTEKHFHFYIEFPNPRSVTAVADDLGIPDYMLQKVHFERHHILQYLTHKNSPEKFQYSDDEVVSNIPRSDFVTPPDIPFDEYLEDFIAYKEGRMTFREFVKKYNMYFTTLSFYSRTMLLSKLHDTASLSRVGGRSSIQEVMEH